MTDPTAGTARRSRQHNGLACEECRARKLRCDMGDPHCGTCKNLGVPCVVNTARRPRGPRKGHVKVLRSRIASLERQLYGESDVGRRENPRQTLEETDPGMQMDAIESSVEQDTTVHSRDSSEDCTAYLPDMQVGDWPKWPIMVPSLDLENEWSKHLEALTDSAYFPSMPTPRSSISKPTSTAYLLDTDITQLDLGSLPRIPAQQAPVQLTPLERADLDELFFERAYLFAPIINQQRYHLQVAQESEIGDPLSCLQHAMWTLAASMGSQFKTVLPLLYAHTCSILDLWEQNIPHETLPIELVQARLLLAIYEILKHDPRKGWISAARCFHLAHILKLDQVDNPDAGPVVTFSWVESEERRRTFWTAYALNRYANPVSGLPLTSSDEMILTRLPAPEEAFRRQQAVKTDFLAESMASKNPEQPLSPYAKSIVILTVLARCLAHRNQCNVERIMDPTSEECLVRHRTLDTLLTTAIQATLSTDDLDPSDPTLLFIDMLAHAAVLVLFTALGAMRDALDAYPDQYACYEKKASKAAERIHSQVQTLLQFGCFKVHPFTPIALFICAEFVRSPKRLHAVQFKTVSAALGDLAAANSLARMLHLKLQRHSDMVPDR